MIGSAGPWAAETEVDSSDSFRHALQLSPLRNSSTATTAAELVAEQLRHFGIDPGSPGGLALGASGHAAGCGQLRPHMNCGS